MTRATQLPRPYLGKEPGTVEIQFTLLQEPDRHEYIKATLTTDEALEFAFQVIDRARHAKFFALSAKK